MNAIASDPLLSSFEKLRQAHTNNTPAAVRINRLDRLQRSLKEHQYALQEALKTDYGSRSEADTLIAEIHALASCIQYHRRHLRRWMKPQRRHVPMHLQPGSARVIYQPVGLVGIVAPWNFPVYLSLAPLVTALSAGNLAMIKTSEFAPATSAALARLIRDAFTDNEVSVIEGDIDTAVAFTHLPFNHLVFTGATTIAPTVMKAAADNLTPVTLELGGKSPALIHPEYPVETAAGHIVYGKAINCGQVCVSPDYVLVHESKKDELLAALEDEFRRRYPTVINNADYTSIINTRHDDRLEGLLSDAEAKGATIKALWPAGETPEKPCRRPLTLVSDTSDDMRVTREEIFGPILPVITYRTLDEAFRYINERERPLALYYFDQKRSRADKVISETISGGVCINECMTHISVDDMPFGGVGPSGMGHYHGVEGFRNFSHARSVLYRGKINFTQLTGAPRNHWRWRLFKRFQAWRLGL
ncbi:coniferyl aldehyde dehydrogenase [uncultured Thalassolituus sp.]|uniref:coniferyl aldehyde dehydrogenase n=1 Tax=uncultured Thalassolituus sp. TaxID=285273 RepID=UPI002612447F|nr:coniferyl aldehyde dehydrogenase [uncultured Thalassolituus sp.]